MRPVKKILTRLLVIVGVWSVSFYTGLTSVQAVTFFQDTFDQNFDRWEVVENRLVTNATKPCQNTGQAAQWQIVNRRLQFQAQATPPCVSKIKPLIPDIEQITSWRMQVRITLTDPDKIRAIVLRQADYDHYLSLILHDDRIALNLLDGETSLFHFAENHYNFQANTTYNLQIEVDDEHHQVRVFVDDEPIPVLASFYPALSFSGYISFIATSLVGENTDFILDNFSLTSLQNDVQLPVPLWKQNDARWGSTRYNHANEWAWPEPSSMARWGCALTSAVMVLRYHGITHVPPGVNMTPATLNDWLLTQPDGYVGEGLLNWRALTRLSWWHRREYHTPALEMRFINPRDKPTWLQTELLVHRPPIVALPGHFAVVTGNGPGEHDFALHDPLYGKIPLPSTGYLSARQFIPSYTDLRALSVVVPGQVSLELMHNGVVIPSTKVTESLATSNQDWTWYDWPLLPNGQYDLSFSHTPDLAVAPAQFYFYHSDGYVQRYPANLTTTSPTTFSLSPDDGLTIFMPPYPPLIEELTMATWLQQGWLKSPLIIEAYLQALAQISQSGYLEEAQRRHQEWETWFNGVAARGWVKDFLISIIQESVAGSVWRAFP